MIQSRVVDLKLFKFNVELHRVFEWAWYYRYHFKRYVKRFIPKQKLTCDFCGEDILAWRMSAEERDPWWYAGCKRCLHTIGWGHYAGAATKEEALDRWARNGGDEFTQKISCRIAPPWLWTEEDSLGLNQLYNYLTGQQEDRGLTETEVQ